MMAMRHHYSDGRSLLFGANDDWMISFLSYLSIQSICRLDVAVSDTTSRVTWLGILCMVNHYTIDEYSHSNQSIRWLVRRGMRLIKLTVRGGGGYGDKVYGSTLLGLNVSSLRYISLSHCDIGDNEVLLIAHGCPHLVEISLSKCQEVTDKCMIELVECCHELISIKVEYRIREPFPRLTASGYACPNQITESLPDGLHTSSLRRIYFSGCNDITDIFVSAISHRSPLLNNVIISNCCKITDLSISALALNCPLLKSINISDSDKFTDIGLKAIAHNCPLLKYIHIFGCMEITDMGFLALAHNCPLLSTLSIPFGKITDDCILALTHNCPLLNYVELFGCGKITDMGVSALAYNCPLLSTLSISYCMITDDCILALSYKCPLLNKIDLFGCDKITDVGVSALGRNCPLLTDIDLTSCEEITDISILALANGCPLLKSICLCNCNQITDVGLLALARTAVHY